MREIFVSKKGGDDEGEKQKNKRRKIKRREIWN